MLLYNLVYTKLKRSTYLAIIPGALVGAIPPIMGWSAAGGSPFDIKIVYIATLIFMWQMPHFWMLLIRFHKDYEKAGYPTLLKKLSESQVRRIVFVWISLSSLFAMTSYLFGIELNFTITIIIVILNLTFIVLFFILLFWKRVETRVAFILTNIFITLLYILFAVGSAINS
jgi:protoheme IX farnesyltransferase